MNKIKIFIAAFIVIAMSAFVLMPVSSVGAAGPLDAACAGNAASKVCDPGNKDAKASDFVGTIVNALLYIVGALSVVMIIVGGIFYVLSAGNSSSLTKAKNTIVYAVIGLVIAFLAFAIVNWVLKIF